MPAGRPTKYRPEMCQQITELMAEGLSKEAAAGALGVTVQTIYNWAEEFPNFLDAIKEGEARCLQFYERAGVDGMMGQIQGFNATAWVFQMKNRAGWRDRVENETKLTLSAELKDKLQQALDAE